MYDPSTHFLIAHEWAYGVTEVVHILSMALGIGLITLVDLHLLGVNLAGASGERLLRATAAGTVAGLVLAITSGLLISSTDPLRYFSHPTMRLKLMLVVVGVAFNYMVHDRVVRGAHTPQVRRTVAVVSLALWTGTVFGGIFYAFT